MPTVMGAFDAILENNKDGNEQTKSNQAKKSYQAHHFANLSPNVQKILSNVPDQEINKTFSSDEALAPKKHSNKYSSTKSLRSTDRNIHKSNESLDIISPNVQKMLSNLPDTELVIPSVSLQTTVDKKVGRNNSFLHKPAKFESGNSRTNSFNDKYIGNNQNLMDGIKQYSATSVCDRSSAFNNCVCDSVSNDNNNPTDNSDSFLPKPLGSYLHTSPSGIASRTPVGRKNLGKYLQVPSESSVGTSSTTSSEVSRPVSLTSLGSCSSSGSSGHHQPGSAYLASAESLDSDQEPTGSQGSADSGIADQPTMSPEMRVLQEVMDTETVYVADLREVIQGYLEPWRADPDCPLAEHLSHLFSNLEEIYEFNRSFLDELRLANCSPTLTANVFLQNDSGFSVYSEYCTNYPRTMDVLSKLTRDEKMAGLFRENQIALRHALPLGSYLLKPVQRILKYHLLLQRLSKQCEPNHKPAVDLALTTMTSIASHINTMKRKHEHAVRVQEIQSQLYGWSGPDLTALGELIAEGTFRVGGARGRRHVFLFDKVLLMAKSKQDGALAYKSHIMCSNLMLVEQVRGEPLNFQILPFDNPRLQCTLRARSPQHKREWTLQIKRVILENYSAVIPNHAWQLVMQLGQNTPENDETNANDKWSLLKQHSTPHYLERRSRVRKSRDGRRTASQDRTFVSLGSWRRKSEPSMIPQYNTKTVPKKISKIKKVKDSGAKFYTDLSDSETCDIIDESNDSLEIKNETEDLNQSTSDTVKDSPNSSIDSEKQHVNNLEQVVSDLLMQNKEFQRILNKHRRTLRESEPLPGIWLKQNDGINLPTKADSLPRNIQLNDQIDCETAKPEEKSVNGCDLSFKEKEQDCDLEEQKETDISSQIDDNEHPEHKIYRKSAIRFSIVQRFRAIMSEDHKYGGKFLTYKQGSRSMGEKIAHPDYADPQKLFANSQNSSQSSLTTIDTNDNNEDFDCDLMGEPEKLDMTINEMVLSEFDKRLKNNSNGVSDTGQDCRNDSSPSHLNNDNSEGENPTFNNRLLNSSQNSDSYYECLLERSLSEESETNKLHCERQNSFNRCYKLSSSFTEKSIISKTFSTKFISYKENIKSNDSNENGIILNSPLGERKSTVKRPTKAPPPIPLKPSRLSNLNGNGIRSVSDPKLDLTNKLCTTNDTSNDFNKMYQNNGNTNINNNMTNQTSCKSAESTYCENSKSWVKAMVGRFE